MSNLILGLLFTIVAIVWIAHCYFSSLSFAQLVHCSHITYKFANISRRTIGIITAVVTCLILLTFFLF